MKNSTKTLQDTTVQMFKNQQEHIELLTEKLNLLQELVDTYKNSLEKRDAYIKSLEELVVNLVTTSKNILHNSENIVNIKKEETVREVLTNFNHTQKEVLKWLQINCLMLLVLVSSTANIRFALQLTSCASRYLPSMVTKTSVLQS